MPIEIMINIQIKFFISLFICSKFI
jgi:hypothetical protein